MGKSSKAPDPPDPFVTAQAQTQQNVETARVQAALNRVNTYGPSGSTIYRPIQGSQFDETGYAGALSRYNTDLSKWQNTPETTQQWVNSDESGGGSYVQMPGRGAAPTAPDRNSFYNAAGDQWESIQNLTPQGQQAFDLQQKIDTGSNQLAYDQLGRISSGLSQPFSYDGMPSSVTSINGSGLPSLSGPLNQRQMIFSPQGLEQAQTGFGDAGQIQSALGDAGQIQRGIGANDFSADRQRVEDALMSRLQPQLQRDRDSLETRLANQGVGLGSDAYRTATDESNRTATDARMQAILAGGQEQSRLFGLDQAQGQFANAAQAQAYSQLLGAGQFTNAAQAQQFGQNQAQGAFANAAVGQNNQNIFNYSNLFNSAQAQDFSQQAAQAQLANTNRAQLFNEGVTNANLQNQGRERGIQEQAYLRSLPINETSALLGLGQVGMPQFGSGGSGGTGGQTGVNGVDLAGITQSGYQNKLGAYQTGVAQDNANTQAAVSAAAAIAAAAFMSDRRVKRDVEQVGKVENGLPLYLFRYATESADAPRRLGLMAQDVERVRPEAVIEINGIKHVDYALALKAA